MIGIWPIGQDIRDFVVAIKDRFDGTQLGAVLVQRRLAATEDQRYLPIPMEVARDSDREWALKTMRRLRRPLPPDFKFGREEIHKRR